MYDSLSAISYYRKIADLNREHGVALVQHAESGVIYVRKDMQVYNRSVYEQLYAHPVKGIPRIYAMHEDAEKGMLTVIEEYIAGDTLENVLLQGGPMTPGQAIGCCMQLCDILEELHGMKPAVVHRDIKPSNLIQKEDGSIVLIDLNAARLETAGEDRDTRLLGTAGYAAPEQYGFGQSSPKADIYAAGKLLTVLLTGDLPSAGKLSPGTSGSVTKQLQRIIERCTRMNPEERYPTAQALRQALNQAAKSSDKAAAKSSGKAAGEAPVRKRRRLFLCLLAGAGAVLLWVNTLRHPEPVLTAVTGNSIVGTYKGDSSDYLELTADGMANYYCAEYTELACPWTETDGVVSIYLPKLHCTITADASNVSSDDELYFTAEHAGWNDESFQRCGAVPASCKDAALRTYDENAVLQSDGTLLYEQCGMQFVLPRQYIDDENSGDSDESWSEFFSTDAETDAYSFLMFYQDEGSSSPFTQESFRTRSREILEQFYDYLDLPESEGAEALTVGGCPAYQCSFTGRLNSGFGLLGKETTSGCITMVSIEETNQVLVILFFGHGDDSGAEREDYETMLQGASRTQF